MTTNETTITIFDSAKAREAAKDDLYFLSSPFIVSPSCTAHLILTAPAGRYRDVSFSILRFPQPLTKSTIHSCLKNVYSRHTGVPANLPTKHPQSDDESRPHYITLGQEYDGNQNPLPDCYDYLTISKPGNYVLYASKQNNPLIDNPDGQPVIVEYAHANNHPCY